MRIRKVETRDVQTIVQLVQVTQVFRDEEINVARELVEIAVNDPQQKDYFISVAADEQDNAVGYYCVGPTPLTMSTFDLYWIAVHPSYQGQGVGHLLLNHCEDFVRQNHGTLIMVETSSLPKYERTRTFYCRHQYSEVARIQNYYAPGDDLILFSKYF
ncbi:MAG: GNAT family N-acetyltransferase [Bacteroidetes bacterium]|nr:GNAT family N-acetyltransferase [Bacteroidota bacterium]